MQGSYGHQYPPQQQQQNGNGYYAPPPPSHPQSRGSVLRRHDGASQYGGSQGGYGGYEGQQQQQQAGGWVVSCCFFALPSPAELERATLLTLASSLAGSLRVQRPAVSLGVLYQHDSTLAPMSPPHFLLSIHLPSALHTCTTWCSITQRTLSSRSNRLPDSPRREAQKPETGKRLRRTSARKRPREPPLIRKTRPLRSGPPKRSYFESMVYSTEAVPLARSSRHQLFGDFDRVQSATTSDDARASRCPTNLAK